jgi:hypothetical protein
VKLLRQAQAAGTTDTAQEMTAQLLEKAVSTLNISLADAQYIAGALLEFGNLAVDQNVPDAVKCYKLAATAGNMEAVGRLGMIIFQDGIEEPKATEDQETKARHAENARLATEALEPLTTSLHKLALANGGNANLQGTLATFYCYKNDRVASTEWQNRAIATRQATETARRQCPAPNAAAIEKFKSKGAQRVETTESSLGDPRGAAPTALQDGSVMKKPAVGRAAAATLPGGHMDELRAALQRRRLQSSVSGTAETMEDSGFSGTQITDGAKPSSEASHTVVMGVSSESSSASKCSLQ